MVRRYNPSHFMKIKNHGDYVAYEDYDKLIEAVKYALSCGIMTATVCKKLEQALKEAENKK